MKDGNIIFKIIGVILILIVILYIILMLTK